MAVPFRPSSPDSTGQYLQDVHSPKAAAHVAEGNRPLAVTALLAFDERQRKLAQAEGLKVKP